MIKFEQLFDVHRIGRNSSDSANLEASLNHSIGSSDGRCVERAGEEGKGSYPQHDNDSQDYPHLSERLVAILSVARVRPRTSKGITDLLLPSWLWLNMQQSL